ncbi:hypothetical protein CP977_28560 [Streptomyces cinereoruber]|uniref:Uncharacterized protein n=1 Tax=Streptomyces cinereoruber TaxID=67260 RepID=A0ABX6BNH6_9ACTN|nr:hypothetical protein CP977_28560 [Streptomyces cinereoruber]
MTDGRRTVRCAPAASPVPLGLTRRHIDLARVAGATCRRRGRRPVPAAPDGRRRRRHRNRHLRRYRHAVPVRPRVPSAPLSASAASAAFARSP